MNVSNPEFTKLVALQTNRRGWVTFSLRPEHMDMLPEEVRQVIMKDSIARILKSIRNKLTDDMMSGVIGFGASIEEISTYFLSRYAEKLVVYEVVVALKNRIEGKEWFYNNIVPLQYLTTDPGVLELANQHQTAEREAAFALHARRLQADVEEEEDDSEDVGFEDEPMVENNEEENEEYEQGVVDGMELLIEGDGMLELDFLDQAAVDSLLDIEDSSWAEEIESV